MKNRIASLFLAFALLMSLCTFAVARDNPIAVQSGGAERFTDVPASHWAYDYIDKVVGSGLFNGKTPTTFEPSNAMTRSQFVMVMARMEGMSSLEGQYTVTKFPDVTPTRRAAGPIAWASQPEQGFVLGFGDGTFKPDSPITRGQFAALIHRYILAKGYVDLLVVDPEPAAFTDASSVSPAFTEDVEYARIHGLLTGYSDGTVRASNPITRAAIAAILARFLDLVTESGYIPLMDAYDNGDTGDTEGPVETETEYSDIKLVVKNGEHGTTSIASVLRDGVQVDPDDLQEGDVVTVSHEPDKGYVVSIRVKDAKNKSVKPVTTKGTISTFKLPKNMPVTVTVTYTKQSSGGGGGGGSSSGGFTSTYYLNVTGKAVPTEGGTVYLTQILPSALPISSLSAFTSIYQSISGFAVFVPNPGYKFVSATADTLTFAEADYKPLTLAGSTVEAKYVTISGTGTTSTSTAPTVNVTANFESTGGTTPTSDKKWEISASGTGANFALAKDAAPTSATQATASLTVENVVNGTDSIAYLAVAPQTGYAFDDTMPAANDGSKIELVSSTDTLRVYKITKNTFPGDTNTTAVTMELSELLKYNLKVTVTGQGSATLKIGDQTETFTKTEEPFALTLTKAQFASLYPERAANNNYKLPLYLTGKPVASKGFKYEDGNTKFDGSTEVKVIPAGTNTADLSAAYFLLDAGTTTHEVTIQFDKIESYGYNLTVIGDGSVNVTFNGKTTNYAGDKNSIPKTYSSGLVVTSNNTVKLGTPTVADTNTLEFEKPLVNDVEKAYNQDITLDEGKLADIVVEIHKKNRAVYEFKVTVDDAGVDGSATVKAEGGKFADSHSFNATTNKDELTNPKTTDTVSQGGPKTYYAYEDTVITITPATTNSTDTKVKSIKVTNPDNASDVITDILAKAGYSFQLKSAKTNAVVTFGTLDAYSFLLQAPYGSSKSLKSKSENIGKNVKVEDIFYSLNDGTKTDPTTNEKGIKNTLALAPTNINTALEYYLTKPVATKKGSTEKVPGKDVLADTLKDSIDISTVLPAVVEAQKSSFDIKTPLKESMETKQADSATTTTETVTGDIRTAMLDALLTAGSDLKQKVDAGTIKKDDIQVKVKVTPILSAAEETKAAYAGLDIAGKSVQTQLEGFMSDYLSKVRVKDNYKDALKPNIQVTPPNGDATITVQASVSSTTGKWPELDNNVTISSYLDKLNIWVAVQVDSVTVNGQDNTPASLPSAKLYNSSEVGSGSSVKSTIEAELKNLDTKVLTTWDTEFQKQLVNGELPVDMGQVLTKDLLDQVVESMLESPMVTVTNKVESLGEGDVTRSAFMNLYRDFVVVTNEKPEECLMYLKTRDDNDKSFVIGVVKNKNLVLTLDFEKILRDTKYQSGNPSEPDMVPYEKLADLLIALRDGVSEDIRTNSTTSQTSQSVMASLFEKQMNAKRGTLKAIKWGDEKTKWSDWTDVEKTEIANLIAELVMNSGKDQSMQEVWQKFEDSGYRAVEYSAGLNANNRVRFEGLVAAFHYGAGSTNDGKLEVGFKVEQGLK